MDVNKVKCFVKGLLIVIGISVITCIPNQFKPHISEATYLELTEVKGIGDHKARTIIEYIKYNERSYGYKTVFQRVSCYKNLRYAYNNLLFFINVILCNCNE